MMFFDAVHTLFGWLFCIIGFCGCLTLFVPSFIGFGLGCLGAQDLKKKYGAEWAVVTGGSSGIGKAIVERLCQQNINVIILAVPDALLSETTAEMEKSYPKAGQPDCQVRT
jgi:hypothetical protein